MKSKNLTSKWAVAALISLGILAAIILNLLKYNNFTDTFLPGVMIGGFKVEGMNMAEAKSMLDYELKESYSQRVSFSYNSYEETVTLGSLCRPIDTDKLVRDVWNEEKSEKWYERVYDPAGKSRNVYPAELEYLPEALTNLEQKWNQTWGTDFRDAELEVDAVKGLVVKPGVPGMKVNAEKTFKDLPKDVSALPAEMRYPIIITTAYPQIDEETLANMGELAAYTTNYKTWEINRSHNLATAAKRLNGAVVAPQEVFSYNKQVGMRTSAAGYLDAKVIVGGKYEDGLGGGICQVSSTLYNAVLLAGMEIVERSNHNLSVSYVPLGQDATVVYGALDFKFKNNTGYPVYIRAVTGGGQLTVNIYGDLAYKKNIKVYSVVDQVFPYSTTTEVDPTLATGTEKIDVYGHPGYIVRAFRTFYDNAGNKIKTEMLARDHYQPLNTLVLQGPPAAGTEPGADGGTDNPETPEPDPGVPGDPGVTPDEGNDNSIDPLIDMTADL